jgi:phosphohistidine swiveling domain-containing protein
MATVLSPVIRLVEAAGQPVALVGGKAATLGRLAAAGLPVPPGLVITSSAWRLTAGERAAAVRAALAEEGWAESAPPRYAVRSSAAAEDLADASWAGQYETILDVASEDVAQAVERCLESAATPRVAAYQVGRGDAGPRAPGMAVLVQPMVPARAAGVAFTANPVTGDRDETLVTAVRGLGERLVSGEAIGDEWSVRGGAATAQRASEEAITAEEAIAVAELAHRVRDLLGGPQDIEWATERRGGRTELVLLQARPMTALPDAVEWAAPGPGLWMRNFRLGEWLPEPVTPLFADWLLPLIEDGYLAGMRDCVGTVVPFRYAVVNGWYFNAVPVPTPMLLARALVGSRGRILRVLYNALFRVGRDPVAADRAVLSDLHARWRDVELPAYARLVEEGHERLGAASGHDLLDLVDGLGRAAGRQLWYLAVVGGSTWKMEARLARFVHEELQDLAAEEGPLAEGVQVLLRGLSGVETVVPDHAVLSADWYWPMMGVAPSEESMGVEERAARRQRLALERESAEARCLDALSARAARAEFNALLDVTRRYTVIREQQAGNLTLGWPLLRACAQRLGEGLVGQGRLDSEQQVFFVTRDELVASAPLAETARQRESRWQAQRRRPAPLTLGVPARLIGNPIARAVEQVRGGRAIPEDAIIGEPASAGRATGRVRVITDPGDFPAFRPGEVLVARATTPAWTPLFAYAIAVVTDGGAMAAHASIVAREYGIPAVVGTGDATHRLVTGERVTVDGNAGTVVPSPAL